MIKMRYGSQGQVSFRDLNEYYFALGFLANSKNAEIRWENNEDQGAWGSEGRIHCLVPESRFPQFFRFTAGRGSVYARINCNDYVGTLVTEHNFNYNSRGQNISKIIETVPEQYRAIFKEGYGGNIDVNPAYRTPSKAGASASSTATRNTSAQSKTSVVTPAPIKQEKPKPQLIPVSVGEKIKHKKFGIGTVYAVENNYVRIRFADVGEKSFINPDAFNSGFLTKA